MIHEPYTHRAEVPPDDGQSITFNWHFQRGLLQPRMSAFELCEFILRHMPHVLPLLTGHPRIKAEFHAMYVMLATNPKAATDRLLPWIRSVTREADDDVIRMSLFDTTPQQVGPTYFVMGGGS